MAQAIVHFVSSAGLVAIFLLMVVEACGIPIPSEVTMPLAGYFVATGHLNAVGAVTAGAGGELVGSLIAYSLAARFGEPLLLGPGRRVGISASHIELADSWFRRYGLYAAFFGRVIPIVRTYISFPAGLARVAIVPFAALTVAGCAIWSSLLVWGGYLLGENYDKLSGPIEKVAILVALAVVAVVGWWFVRGRHARSEAAH